MKSHVSTLLLSLALGFAPAMAQDAQQDAAASSHEPTTLVVSLEDCLRVALSENPTVKVADMEIKRMDYSRIETLSSLLPQISFSGTYGRTIAKQVMYMNMDISKYTGGGGSTDSGTEGDADSKSRADAGAAGKSDGIKVGLDNSYQLGFSASLPLIAPQLWAALKLSDTQILASVEQARASKLNLVNEVKNAYYALLFAVDSRDVIQQNYDMAAFTHELYKKKYEAGAASDYDVLRTSVAMKNVEPQISQAEIAIKQARLKLAILMGLDTDFLIVANDSLQRYEGTMYGDALLASSQDVSNNTQLIMNQIQTKQLEQALKVQKAAVYPTLAASASYSWTSMSDGSPFKNFRWNPYSMVGLSLNVPLFTGGSRWSKVKQAQVQLDEMKWQRENLERNVQMQVDLAVDNINVNVQQIASSSENVGQATRAHDIMQKSFTIGSASYIELRDSELALTQSQLTYYQAIYDYLVSQSQLELLLGTAKIEY